jgi:hypothetical protein
VAQSIVRAEAQESVAQRRPLPPAGRAVVPKEPRRSKNNVASSNIDMNDAAAINGVRYVESTNILQFRTKLNLMIVF